MLRVVRYKLIEQTPSKTIQGPIGDIFINSIQSIDSKYFPLKLSKTIGTSFGDFTEIQPALDAHTYIHQFSLLSSMSLESETNN